MSEPLKPLPCPVCRGPAEEVDASNVPDWFILRCRSAYQSGECWMSTEMQYHRADRDDNVRDWNTRAQAEVDREALVEEVSSCIDAWGELRIDGSDNRTVGEVAADALIAYLAEREGRA